MSRLTKFLLFLILSLILAAAAALGSAYYWVHKPLQLPSQRVDILVPPGATPLSIAKLINQAQIPLNNQAFVVMARLGELDKTLKAGGYQIIRGDSAWDVLKRMAQGDVTQRQLTIVEGWNLKQIRQALTQHPDVKQTLSGLSDSDLIGLLDPAVKQTLFNTQSVSDAYAPTDRQMMDNKNCAASILDTAYVMARKSQTLAFDQVLLLKPPPSLFPWKKVSKLSIGTKKALHSTTFSKTPKEPRGINPVFGGPWMGGVLSREESNTTEVWRLSL